MVIGKLKKLMGCEEKTRFVKILEYLEEAKFNLANAEDNLKDEIKEIRKIKKLSADLGIDLDSVYTIDGIIRSSDDKLKVIEYRLRDLKEIIESMEKMILDAKG